MKHLSIFRDRHQPIRDVLHDLHGKKAFTPTMGGVMIITASFLVCSTRLYFDSQSGEGAQGAGVNFYSFWAICLGCGAIGFLDDYYKLFKSGYSGIRGKARLTMQAALIGLVISSMKFCDFVSFEAQEMSIPGLATSFLDMLLSCSEINVPVMNYALSIPNFLYIPFAILVIISTCNSVNITDGIDGLATVASIIALSFLSIVSYVSSDPFLSTYFGFEYIEGARYINIGCLCIIGALLGFLWYNFSPAQIFMGDSGSLFLGGAIGAASVMLKQELMLLIFGGVFVLEAMSVIIQVFCYQMFKYRPFLISPIHHHFERLGISEVKILGRFLIVCALLFCFAIKLSLINIGN